jgi:membrane-bound lytic murein transglycosylase D
MSRTLGLTSAFALGLCAACAPQRPAPVAPVSTAPAAAPQEVAAAAPAAQTPAPTPAPDSTSAQASAPIRRANVTRPAPDTAHEQAFLDSLHSLAADSTPRATVAPVGAEDVQQEAATLFGHSAATSPDTAATWDIDVTPYAQYDRVQYWVDYFTGVARPHFERYLERAGRYDSMIRTRLAAAGLPQDLIYLAMIESGFAQSIRSRAGAVGMWQFMPSTARRYGLTVDAWTDERRDPYLATDAAIRFLSELNNRFGSLYLAAAAYNSGPGKIQRGLDRGDYGDLTGNDVYFAMAEGTFLRRETRDYVPKLIAAALLAKEPARYGFTNLDVWSPLSYDSVQVNKMVGIDVLGRLAGTSRDEMEDLNPSFYRGVTPPDRTVWIKVPPGTVDRVATRLASLPASERVTVLTHVVSRGETLGHIAMRYHSSVSDIKMANHLRSNLISIGQRLVIPTSMTGRASSGTRANRTRPASSRTASRGTASSRATGRRHIVQRGETLSGIATRFRVGLDDLMQVNGLTRRSVLHPGQALRLPN